MRKAHNSALFEKLLFLYVLEIKEKHTQILTFKFHFNNNMCLHILHFLGSKRNAQTQTHTHTHTHTQGLVRDTAHSHTHTHTHSFRH